MNPVDATTEQVAWWVERDAAEAVGQVLIGGPDEGPDVIPCPTLVTDGPSGRLFHVALQLDEIELMQLANGGTLWLTTWGGLPIHLVEVTPSGLDETLRVPEDRA